MDFFHKITDNPYTDLYWNVPEAQQQGSVTIFGGNSQSFNTEVRVAELFTRNYPLKDVRVALPDALQAKLPPLNNLVFLPSTDSGSFANSASLEATFSLSDINLLLGDFSKNSITEQAILDTTTNTIIPTYLVRDTIDLIANKNPERLLMNSNIVIFASMAQLQKLFRAVYYPKMLLLSMPLMQVADTLHKFTLSYPVSLIVFHDGQFIIAQNSNVYALPLTSTKYSPLTMWGGELFANIVALNLYNPNQFIPATIAAILKK